MLDPFAKDIWISEGPVVSIAGFHYGTRMVVIRLSTNGLFVWSPIALNAELKAQVDALGPLHFIVAPNAGHRMFLDAWTNSYPEARVFGPPHLIKTRPHIPWAGALTNAPERDWSADIDQVLVKGNVVDLETVFFHRASRTVIFTDLIQHFDHTWFKGWRAIIAKLDFMTAPEPEVPRKFRLAFVRSRAARAAIKQILHWPIERVVMAHAEPVAQNGHAFVAKRFRWLKFR